MTRYHFLGDQSHREHPLTDSDSYVIFGLPILVTFISFLKGLLKFFSCLAGSFSTFTDNAWRPGNVRTYLCFRR